jgi:hypothetical protein
MGGADIAAEVNSTLDTNTLILVAQANEDGPKVGILDGDVCGRHGVSPVFAARLQVYLFLPMQVGRNVVDVSAVMLSQR